MAAATIELPAIGRVPRNAAIAGGAALAGVIGFAYVQHARKQGEPAVVYDPAAFDPAGGLLPAKPYVSQGGSGLFGGEDPEGNEGIDTNSEWFQAAHDYLHRYGVDDQASGVALGKFLGRQPLTTQEQEWVRLATGAFGAPPIDGPWNVIAGGAGGGGTGTALAHAPSPVYASPMGSAHAYIQWGAVPGATGYEIRRVNVDGSGATPWLGTGNALHHTSVAQVATPTSFAWEVRGVNSAGPGPAAGSNHLTVQP